MERMLWLAFSCDSVQEPCLKVERMLMPSGSKSISAYIGSGFFLSGLLLGGIER